jgi:hypothetical protein
MAEWKKVIVSGSAAVLSQVNVGTNQQITTSQTTTFLTGSFTGSFKGDGSGLTGVTNATTLASLTQGTGITAFTFNGATAQTVALKNAGSLSNNVLQKWDSGNGQLTNASLTDNGTTITGATSIQLTGANSNLSGSFSGSFQGNGAGLTGVTATAIFPTTAKTDLATTDQIYINDGANKYVTYGNLVTDLAGSGAGTSNLTTTDTGDSLALTAQVTVTGVTASLFGTASWANNATNATTATNATNTAVTDTTSGTGPYYVTFVDNTTGNLAQRVDSTGLTYNATTNTLTATASYAVQALSSSFASTAPYSGLTGIPAGIVSASVLSSPSQGNAVLTTNGVAGSTIDLGLTSAASPTFVDLTLTGDAAVNGGDLTTSAVTFNLVNSNATTVNFAGAATTLNIGNASGTATIPGNAVVQGNFTVNGTTTYLNVQDLFVEDKFIVLASGSATAGDGGIIIDRGSDAAGNIAYGYDSVTDRWGFQNGVTDTTNTIDPTSAAGVSGSFVPYLFTENDHGATKPITGEFAVQGAMYTSNAGDIWIYA